MTGHGWVVLVGGARWPSSQVWPKMWDGSNPCHTWAKGPTEPPAQTMKAPDLCKLVWLPVGTWLSLQASHCQVGPELPLHSAVAVQCSAVQGSGPAFGCVLLAAVAVQCNGPAFSCALCAAVSDKHMSLCTVTLGHASRGRSDAAVLSPTMRVGLQKLRWWWGQNRTRSRGRRHLHFVLSAQHFLKENTFCLFEKIVLEFKD